MQQFIQKALSRLSSSAGFSLVEVFISLFVFAIGMLAVTAMCLISIQGNSMANRVTQANFLAQSKMEELLGDPDVCSFGNATDIPGLGYTRTTNITAAGDACWITVTMDWEDSTGSHDVELKTMARGN